MAMSGAALGQPENKARGQFSGRLGFILAAVGSAVGLGNIVRFPYSVAENGGALFILFYLVILFLIGVPVMLAELGLGRKGKLNPVGTFRKLSSNSRVWTALGMLFVVTSVFIISWYSVTAGTVLRYVFASAGGEYFGDPAGFLSEVSQGRGALGLHLLSMVAVTVVLMFGVSKGIERVAFIMMPILVVLLVGIAIYVGTLNDAGRGYAFYFKPDFGEFSTGTLTSAAGQAFFSLSLGQGAILTYASYLDERESLSENGVIISIADTGVAIMGGLLVFPALAATGFLGIDPSQVLFVGTASAFEELGNAGRVLGTTFFLALYFAAFTSLISLLEVSIAFVTDQWGVSRPKAALLMGLVGYTIGIIAAINGKAAGFMAGKITDIVVIGGGLIISLFAGYVMLDAREEMDRGGRLRLGNYALFMVRYPIPAILAVLLALAVYDFGLEIQALIAG